MSSTTGQFPPSSPLLDTHQLDHEEDPFNCGSNVTNVSKGNLSKEFVINSPFNSSKVKTSKGKIIDNAKLVKPVKDHYPTPNPSSSLGNRSSSPVREELQPLREEIIIKERTDFHPSGSKIPLIVKLTSSDAVTLGRSTQCDYFIKSKFASRNHLSLKYDPKVNELSLLCTGFNGVILRFNAVVCGFVKELSENKFYFERLDHSDKEDERFKEISLFKGEQLTLSYEKNLSLDVKGYEVKIMNYLDMNDKLVDESETEDELPILNNSRLSSISPQVDRVVTVNEIPASSPPKAVDTTTVDQAERIEKKKMEKELDELFSPPKSYHKPQGKPQQTPAKKEPLGLERSKSLEHKSQPQPSLSSSLPSSSILLQRCKSTESLKKVSIINRIVSDFEQEGIMERKPLKLIDESILNSQLGSQQERRTHKLSPGNSPIKKKVHTKLSTDTTEEPIKRTEPPTVATKPKKLDHTKLQEILASISNLEDIQNVVINHLSFSRLLQTPLNQLQTISHLTSTLRRSQLRAVLHSIQCIGVIYRSGKDAAGKPLDEEYYYDVEKDIDRERKALIMNLKGARVGLRACRKTHKQYFWKKPGAKK